MAKILRQSEIVTLLRQLGMGRKNARIGSAIALCEAPYKPFPDGEFASNFSAIGDIELADDIWGYSYGGFQIRSMRAQKGTGGIRDEDRLLRPRFNCRSAIAIYRSSNDWTAWSTYNSGMYKAYLQEEYPPPPNTYIVQAYDTLMNITDKLSGGEWTWEELAAANSLSHPYVIYIGQHLRLP